MQMGEVILYSLWNCYITCSEPIEAENIGNIGIDVQTLKFIVDLNL